jgi:hypothetical protein|tara:strand:+ start:610 stop:999 length:390 start_codon:yes stop_codon:yes gene_type:complete
MWGGLISGVLGIAGSYVDGKVSETKAKSRARVADAEARAEVSKKVAAGEVEWENTMADATKGSWKDELALVVLLLPLPFTLYEPTREGVREAFVVLESLPSWYQYLLFIAISSSFGIKGADKLMSLRKK